MAYCFDRHELDPDRFELRTDGASVRIEPRAFDLLHHLIRHRDRVVAKTELLDQIWGSRFVSDAALTTAIRQARASVGDTGADQRVIRTVHGRGYQFVAPLQAAAVVAAPVAAPEPENQSIRYCAAPDGATIAYASVGSGPPLLKAANWMSHLDLEWSSPVWGHWLRGLGRGRELIRYDERGCGLSEWDVPDFVFEDWVSDLEAVVAASGLDRFPLLGVSQGAAVAVAYAARHPDRVTQLILAGGYARGRNRRARNERELAAARLDLDLARVGWSDQDPSFMRVFASQFLPGGTPREWAEFTDFQRRTTSSANAVRFLEVFADIDVSALAPKVRCPTLVLHSRDDARVPASQALELAALVPDSELVLLDSSNHLLSAHEPAWPVFLQHIDDFLGR